MSASPAQPAPASASAASGRPSAPASIPAPRRGPGVVLALVSSLSFGLSGPFAKVLFSLGWTPAAAVLVRDLGGAVLVAAAAAWMLRAQLWRTWRAGWRRILVFGLFGVGGVQLCYFTALRTIPVSVAMLVEYSSPVLVLIYVALRSRRLPSRATLLGAALTVAGLIVVIDMPGSGGIDPVGVLWAAGAALGNVVFFIIAARPGPGIPPLALAAGGLGIGGAAVAIVGVSGMAPLAFSAGSAPAGQLTIPWWAAVLVMVVLASAFAYTTGILAAARLGARPAAFLDLTEVLFAILTAWLLLGETPTLQQAIGAALIVSGLIVMQRDPAPST